MEKIDFHKDILPLKNKLFRLALRITLDRADAEDAVQDTMIKVWNRRDRWEEIESVEAFCLTVCRNIALDKIKALRKEDVRTGSLNADATDSSYRANPEEWTEQKDKVAAIKHIMDSLPEKQRSAMHLRDFEAYSYKEIAAIMGISEGQVKVNIFRARQTIKRKYIEADRNGL